jgi:hypothetical protein
VLSRKLSDPRSCPLAVGLDKVASFYLGALFWGGAERGSGSGNNEETKRREEDEKEVEEGEEEEV